MKFFSKIAASALIMTGASVSAFAAEPAQTPEQNPAACREESLAKFISGGQEVPSKVIGAADPCDRFGGNEAYTPGFGIRVYVNFNVAVTLDLDAIDAVFDEVAPNHPEIRRVLSRINVVVVRNDWIKEVHLHDEEIHLNMTGTLFFITEKAVNEGRLEKWLRVLYSIYGQK